MSRAYLVMAQFQHWAPVTVATDGFGVWFTTKKMSLRKLEHHYLHNIKHINQIQPWLTRFIVSRMALIYVDSFEKV